MRCGVVQSHSAVHSLLIHSGPVWCGYEVQMSIQTRPGAVVLKKRVRSFHRNGVPHQVEMALSPNKKKQRSAHSGRRHVFRTEPPSERPCARSRAPSINRRTKSGTLDLNLSSCMAWFSRNGLERRICGYARPPRREGLERRRLFEFLGPILQRACGTPHFFSSLFFFSTNVK